MVTLPLFPELCTGSSAGATYTTGQPRESRLAERLRLAVFIGSWHEDGGREKKKGRIKKKPKSEESGMTAEDRRRRENRVGGDGGRACNPGEFNPAGHWKSKPGCSLGRRQSRHIVCQHWDNPGGWDNKSGPKCSRRPRIFFFFFCLFLNNSTTDKRLKKIPSQKNKATGGGSQQREDLL